MFSSRTRWDLTANRLASLAEARRAAGAAPRRPHAIEPHPGRDSLPGRPVVAPLRASALRYEPSPFGLRAAREAVAADYRGAERGGPGRPHRAHGQQQRGLRLPLQAALRPRDRPRPAPELSLVRVPGRPRVRDGGALPAPPRRRMAPGPAALAEAVDRPDARGRRGEPEQPHGLLREARGGGGHPADRPRGRGRR